MNIKLRLKLNAFTPGVLPNVKDYIKEAPEDDKIYGRSNKEWVELKNGNSNILDNEYSGINIEREIEGVKLSIKQVIDTQSNITNIEDDTTYYIVENTPEIYINGGTAFSNNEEYGCEQILEINGGTANTIYYKTFTPINSKGVSND